jgi:hypothetical protein
VHIVSLPWLYVSVAHFLKAEEALFPVVEGQRYRVPGQSRVALHPSPVALALGAKGAMKVESERRKTLQTEGNGESEGKTKIKSKSKREDGKAGKEGKVSKGKSEQKDNNSSKSNGVSSSKRRADGNAPAPKRQRRGAVSEIAAVMPNAVPVRRQSAVAPAQATRPRPERGGADGYDDLMATIESALQQEEAEERANTGGTHTHTHVRMHKYT